MAAPDRTASDHLAESRPELVKMLTSGAPEDRGLYGFEFTIPLHLKRFAPWFHKSPAPVTLGTAGGVLALTGLIGGGTLVVTFIVMKILGQSFNLMTLGGLAAAVGLVIDDKIVVVENIVLHRDGGEGPLQGLHRLQVCLVF